MPVQRQQGRCPLHAIGHKQDPVDAGRLRTDWVPGGEGVVGSTRFVGGDPVAAIAVSVEPLGFDKPGAPALVVRVAIAVSAGKRGLDFSAELARDGGEPRVCDRGYVVAVVEQDRAVAEHEDIEPCPLAARDRHRA